MYEIGRSSKCWQSVSPLFAVGRLRRLRDAILAGASLAALFACGCFRLLFAYNPMHGRNEAGQYLRRAEPDDRPVRVHPSDLSVDHRCGALGARRHQPSIAAPQFRDCGLRGARKDDFEQNYALNRDVRLPFRWCQHSLQAAKLSHIVRSETRSDSSSAKPCSSLRDMLPVES